MNERFNLLPDARRKQIINGAMQAFAEHGYEKCSMADVAKRCGVSKPLLFHYFETKADLFAYLRAYAVGLKRQAEVGLTLKSGDDLLDTFANLVKRRVSFLQLNAQAYQFVESLNETREMANDNDDLHWLKQADARKLRKGFGVAEILKLLQWVADGFIAEHAQKTFSERRILADLDNWLVILRRVLYKDKHQ